MILLSRLQTGGLDDYLTSGEVPWLISLIIGIVMQHKEVFKRYLINWKTEKCIYAREFSQNQNGEKVDIIGESLVSIMLLRALMKLRDNQSHR